jgi:hypothetical protein
MSTPPPSPDGDGAVLDELVFRYLEQLDGSDSDPARLLDELCAEEPQHAAGLRNSVERLRAAGLLPASGEEFPERIGDFRLERRLGAGGMGVVYLAEQVSLGRRVALKLVRPEQLYFNRTRERFRREVESVARLAHPGIAHVHTVGEHDGVPYFAQEYVPGASLDVVLRAVPEKAAEGLAGRDLARALASCVAAAEAPARDAAFFAGTWEAVCLRIVRAAADALQHAHERGVLHRDVKPSNLILAPDGRVVLVDFGLASLADANALTRTGAQLGSLPYMSPEQVDGRADDIGPVSDVYALGVTLYELLTLRVPYAADSSERLRRQILEARPLPPRAHNAGLGVDAETVCMCAMDADPRRRYASAAALAQDVGNVLERRPPRARPLGRVRRAVRWAQRSPALAVAYGLGAVLLLGGPITWGVVQAQHASDMTAAADRESRASSAAERHFRSVLDTLDSMIRRIGDTEFEALPGMTALQLEAIDRALVAYRELELERPDDPLLAERQTWAYRLRGNTLHEMVRFAEAIAAYDDGLELSARFLDVEDERSADRQWEHGALLSLRARCNSRLGRYDESVENGARALTFMDESLRSRPDPSRAGDAVTTLVNIASSRRQNRDREGCAEVVQSARARAAEWLDDEPLDRRQRKAHLNLLTEEARLAEYDADLDLALDLRLELVERVDEERARGAHEDDWADTLTPALVELSSLYARRGERAAEREVLERAVRETRRLVERFPYRSIHRVELLSALGAQANLARLEGRFEEGRAGMLEVAEGWMVRVALDPGNAYLTLNAANAWSNAANVVMMSGDLGPERYERALELLARAAQTLDATQAETGSRQLGVRRFIAYNSVVCNGQLGRIDDARASIAVLEEHPPETAGDLRFLADAWNEWFLAVERRAAEGDLERANVGRARVLELLEQAVARGYRELDELRTTPALDPLRGEPRFAALLAVIEASSDD